MSEFDTLNYAEHAYAKQAEGKLRIFKILMLIGYGVFVGAFFLFCYLTRIILVFENAEGKYGVLFDGTTQSAKMIAAYCPAAKILRSYTFSK